MPFSRKRKLGADRAHVYPNSALRKGSGRATPLEGVGSVRFLALDGDASRDSCCGERRPPTRRPFSFLRRSGSKVMSVLRPRSGDRSSTKSSSTHSELPTTPALAKRVVTPMFLITPTGPKDSHNLDTNKLSVLEENTLKVSDDTTSSGYIFFDTGKDRRHHKSPRHSRSMPGLTYNLSHRFSSTFGNPTIVHRPNLRARPSVSSIQEISARVDSLKSIPTNQSSPQNGRSVSTVDTVSTAKTSIESTLLSRQASGREQEKLAIPLLIAQESAAISSVLTPISELPIVAKPTIKTIETTANAKVFFETHFDSIFRGTDTRQDRRYDLEKKLIIGGYTEDQCRSELCLWAQLESEYLRQLRVLRSQSNLASRTRGVAVGGYEVVRVLGKGSFGVVRLVRERTTKAVNGFSDHQNRHVETQSSGTDSRVSFKADNDSRKSFGLWRTTPPPKEVFAMKVIRKSEMLRNSQEGHLRAERDFLVASEKSRWVVPLITSFQDHTNLYLVMEYMIGGDFLGLLIKYDRLSENWAQFYLAEMVLCLEETHRMKWIHRDVKPDNFLVSSTGHLKISDFGLAFDGQWQHDQSYVNQHRYALLEKFEIPVEGDLVDRAEITKANAGRRVAEIFLDAKERKAKARHAIPSGSDEGILKWRNRYGRRAFAKSVVGTSQYMAPEVIRGEEYDGRCDWWSIGIILYECLYGETPFLGRDRQETKMNILQHKSTFSFVPNSKLDKKWRVSSEAKRLISDILQEKKDRLCSDLYKQNDVRAASSNKQTNSTWFNPYQDSRGYFVYPDDATEIKAHPFFRGIDWRRLHLQRAPEVPRVKDRCDTKYFDQEPPISDVDDVSSTSSMHEEQIAAQERFEEEIAKEFEKKALEAQNAGNPDPIKVLDGIVKAEHVKLDQQTSPREVTIEGPKKTNGAKAKKKTRPRDRILRDKDTAKEALELRKQGAFTGYTYLRPTAVLAMIENCRPDVETI